MVMTIEERLIELRRDWSPKQAFWAMRQVEKTNPHFWMMNALAFDWHRQPTALAVLSFKYSEALRKKQEDLWTTSTG